MKLEAIISEVNCWPDLENHSANSIFYIMTFLEGILKESKVKESVHGHHFCLSETLSLLAVDIYDYIS